MPDAGHDHADSAPITPLPGLDLALISEHAMRRGTVAMVLERMGFERFAGPMPRGGIIAFDDAYARLGRAARDRVRHLHGDAQAALFARDRRTEATSFNRSLAAHPVLLLARDNAPATAVWFDTVSGAWRHAAGGPAGEDIVTLGAIMWQCRIGQAVWRCARLAGVTHVLRR
ncbi:hypothetical protein GXW71_33710 [Roseomonas hellenica]|uniref:Uncharacterized protein n=1 Tax=Plastoroseomonas hellenica TaxID=2687306 RepID=A0ABS5F9X8_9PROT|nr:hypothetical protein [Plastoroseomonas hellenica]MBR0669355.1 hypothetical protein [Plastoroseomonas hellenica]